MGVDAGMGMGAGTGESTAVCEDMGTGVGPPLCLGRLSLDCSKLPHFTVKEHSWPGLVNPDLINIFKN